MSDAPPPNWGGPPPPPQGPSGPTPPSYGQQPPPPGYQSYGAGISTTTHPQGTAILVLGILSLLCFGIVLGPIAWIMGQRAIREMNENPSTTYTNRGLVNAGRICGIIGTVLSLVGIVVLIAR